MNHRALPLSTDWPTRPHTAPARRCTGCMDQGDYDCCRVDCPAPDEAATEVGHSDGAPLTRAESLRFWLVVSAPAFVGVVGFAALLWAFKP